MMDYGSVVVVLLAIVLLGIAKGGFGGVGAPVALPLMTLGMPAELALGVILPLLMAMDVVSLRAHWANIDRPSVLYALPSAAAGVLWGSAVIAYVPATFVGGLIGLLSILFALQALSGRSPNIAHWPGWTSGLFGATSGLTSTIAHAGGPPIHIYFLSKAYAPAVFVATSAAFMAGVNLLKLVPFVVIGALDREAALWALGLAPVAVAAAALGVWISRRLSKTAFKYAVNGLLLIVGAKLILDALT
ncbi:sulfite exporter TauE/SafE family protein [Roseobacteraceae bacterium S113]